MWNDLSKKVKRFLVALILLIAVFWGLLLCYFFNIGITSHDGLLVLLLVYLIMSGVWLFFAIADMVFYHSTYFPEDRSDMLKMVGVLFFAILAWCALVQFFYNMQ